MVANLNFRWTRLLGVVCTIAALTGCPSDPGNPTGEITITLPGGGEQWPQGTTQTIAWTPRTGGGTTVTITLRRGTTPAGTLGVDVSNSGSFAWQIAADRTPASDYRIVIEDDLGETESAPFAIVQAEPRFATSDTAHTFGPTESSWTFDVWNAGTPGTQLQFQVTANRNWIVFDPPSGTSTGPDDAVTVTVNLLAAQLSGGNNSGAISLTSDDAPTRTVNIFANRPQATIGLDPVSTYDFGFLGTDWAFDVWNDGEVGSALNFTVFADKAWVTVSPAEGTSASERDTVTVDVSIDRALLPAGTSSANVSVVGEGVGTKTIKVSASRPAPVLSVSSVTHDFGTTATRWTFDVWNSGNPGSVLAAQLFANQDWAVATPATVTSTGPDDRKTVTVTVDRGGLSPGDNSATLTASGEGTNSANIALAARRAIPAVSVSSTSFDFGRTENSWQFMVVNAGEANSTLDFGVTSDVPWASVSPASGSSANDEDPAVVTVTLNRSLLSAGNNSGNITVQGVGVGEKRIGLKATKPQPAVAVSAPSFDFGTSATSWTFEVWNAGDIGSVLNFQVAPDMDWLSVGPASGASTGADDRKTITVTVDRGRLPAGNNSARLTVSSEAGGSSQVSIAAQRGVPSVAVSAKTFDFGAGVGTWAFDVWNSGEAGSTLDFTVFTDKAWLGVSPGVGSSVGSADRQAVAVTIDRDLLATGNNNGKITVSSEDGGTETITVTATKPSPAIAVSATAFDFGTATDIWTFDVWNNGDALSTLDFQVFADKAWLAVNPESSFSTGEDDRATVTVTLDRSALAVGNNSGRITILSEEVGERVINVTASRPSPRIAVSGTSFDFGRNQTTWGFDVWNAGDAGTTLNFTVSPDKSWLSVSPESGTSSGVSDRARVTVTLDRAMLPAGANTGTLRVTGNDGANAVTINVSAMTPSAAITVSGESFNAGTTETTVSFDVWNSGDAGTTLSFTVSSDQPWATPAPASGTSSDENDRQTVAVGIDRSLLTSDSGTARVTVSAPGATSKSVTVNASRPKPVIAVSSTSYNFGTSQSTYSFDVWNADEGGSTLAFTAAPDRDWISVAPAEGESTGPEDRQTLTVTIDRSMLPAGNSSGRINLTSLRGGNAQIGFTVEVPSPVVATNVADHDFGKFETSWSFDIWNSGPAGTTLDFEITPKATWISVSPLTGTSTGIDDRTTVTVTLDRGLLPGTGASNRVEISGPGVSTRSVNIVAAQPVPAISTSTTSHTFAIDSSTWTFDVWNGGDVGTTLDFLVTKDQDWISVSPAQGESDDETDPVAITVTIDRGAIPEGQKTGVVTVVDQYNKTRNVAVAVEKPAPSIQTSADNHDFGAATSTWTFEIWNAGDSGTTLDFFVAVDQDWLSASPTSGSSTGPTDRQTISVTANRALLPVGTVSGNISITADGLSNKVKIGTTITQNKAVFVDAAQQDFDADGTSWTLAYPTLEAGVAAALERHVHEVWLQAGAYGSGPVVLSRGLILRGGFGAGETVLRATNATDPLVTVASGATLVSLVLEGAHCALRVTGGTVLLEKVAFRENWGEEGAAIQAENGAVILLDRCVLEDNVGASDAAAHIWLEGAELETWDSRIVEDGLPALSHDEDSIVFPGNLEILESAATP